MADQSTLCSLTNNTGKDVVVALAVSADETASPDAVLSANQQLEILKTSAGGTTIKSGSSDTVTLDHNYKDGAGETGYVQNYDLIISDSTWLYPLADLSVIQQGSNGSASYAPQTVDATNQVSMAQAFDFYQTIAVYPSSQLATDYTNTLQQAQDAALALADGSPGSAKAVADAIENAIDAFFKGTDQYKDVTLADIVAADNYYNNFPFVWAQYKDSITYYLYGSDGTTAVFAGTLSLNNPGTVDITQPNSGYTCSFAPAVNPADTSKTDVDATQSVSLTYIDGLFLNDVTVDAPAIGLKGSFLLERLFTNDPDDNNVISVLSGMVNGISCVGFDIPQPAPPKTTSLQTAAPTALSASPAEKYWDTLIHPKSQQDLIISLLTLAGAILLIPVTAFAIYGIYKIARYRAQKAQAEALAKEIVEWYTKQTDFSLDGKTGKFCGLNKDWFVEKNFNNIKGYNEVLLADAKAVKLAEAFGIQWKNIQELQKYEVALTRAQKELLQDSFVSMHSVLETMLELTPTEIVGALPHWYDVFSNVQTAIQQVNSAIQNKLSKDAKKMVDDNITESSRIYEEIQNLTEKDIEDESAANPEIREEIKPLE